MDKDDQPIRAAAGPKNVQAVKDGRPQDDAKIKAAAHLAKLKTDRAKTGNQASREQTGNFCHG